MRRWRSTFARTSRSGSDPADRGAGFSGGPDPNIALSCAVDRDLSRLTYPGFDGICVVRFDNEVGKGDRRHIGEKESVYTFTTPDKLIADFRRDMARWNRENRYP